MNEKPSPVSLVVNAVLLGIIVGLIAGILTSAGGAHISEAILLAGGAFAGAVTLSLGVLYALRLL